MFPGRFEPRLFRLAVLATGMLIGLVGLPSPSAVALSAHLTRFPYLTDALGSSATANWATDRSVSTGSVSWGTPSSSGCSVTQSSAGTKIGITVNSVSEYQWQATLTGLAAGTEYCYRVFLGTTDLLGSDPSPVFTSQPSGTPFSFAVIGDWGFVDSSGSNPNQDALISLIANSSAEFVVTAGDQPYGTGSQTNYGDLSYSKSTLFGPSQWPVAGRSIPIFPMLGNEGLTGTVLKDFPETHAVSGSQGRSEMDTYCCLDGTKSATYPTVWYAFNVGDARFYVLDASWRYNNVGTGTIYKDDYDYHWTQNSPEYQWLRNDLASHTSGLKFAFFHFPLYDDTTSQTSDTYLQGSKSLEGLLNQYGVDIAFSGHSHIYERNLVQPGSLVSYVTGGGGGKLLSIATCSSFDGYAIGWSPDSNVGSSCHAPKPSSAAQVYHFLLVSVDGTTVTVSPTNSLGGTFDVQSYNFG